MAVESQKRLTCDTAARWVAPVDAEEQGVLMPNMDTRWCPPTYK